MVLELCGLTGANVRGLEHTFKVCVHSKRDGELFLDGSELYCGVFCRKDRLLLTVNSTLTLMSVEKILTRESVFAEPAEEMLTMALGDLGTDEAAEVCDGAVV